MNTGPNPAHVAARVVQDAFIEAAADCWLDRARQLEAARPRPGDYTGRSTPADRAATHRRLTEAAQACRNRATQQDTTRALLADAVADAFPPEDLRRQAVA